MNQSCLQSTSQPSTFEVFSLSMFINQGSRIADSLQRLNETFATHISTQQSRQKAIEMEHSLKSELKTVTIEMDKIKGQNTILTEETICLSKIKS